MARNGESATRLYVGRLSNVTRDIDLDEEFRRFGRVRDVEIKSGFAFVEFYDPRDADHALSVMNGRVVHGSQLVVQFARLGPRGSGPGRGGGSGRYGDERRDAFYDDRYGGGRPGLEDRNFAGGPRNRSRDLSPDRYGNGRGRGRGGRGGRALCYNCGRVGHIARDCEEGDWSNRCYECGQYGHIKRRCPELSRNTNTGRSRSRSPRDTMIRRRSRSPGYRRRRSRSPPSPDSYVGRHSPRPYGRRSRSPPYRSGRRSPGNDYRRRHSRSPDYRRGRSRSPPYVPRRDLRSPEHEVRPNDSAIEPSPFTESLSERHADDNGGERHGDNNGGAPPIQRDVHRSPGQRDQDGGVRVVPYNNDSDNDEQKKRSELTPEEEEAVNNLTQSFEDEEAAINVDDDPVDEDEDMALPAINNSPRDEAADGEEEKFDFEKNSGESSESD